MNLTTPTLAALRLDESRQSTDKNYNFSLWIPEDAQARVLAFVRVCCVGRGVQTAARPSAPPSLACAAAQAPQAHRGQRDRAGRVPLCHRLRARVRRLCDRG